MKIGDVLARSMDNVIANWETVLLEFCVLAALAVGIALGMMSAVMPLLMNIGHMQRMEIARIAATVIVAVVAGGFVSIVVTAFPAAASTRLYIDGVRAAAAAPERTRASYRTFSFPAWLAAGRAMWARVFGIEIVAAAIAAIIIGIPFLLLFLLPRAVAGCCGFIFVFPLALVTILSVTLCARKAVAVAIARDAGVEESLGIAWREVRSRFVAHFLPLLIIGVFTAVASVAFGMVGFAVKVIASSMGYYVSIIGPILRSAPAAAGSCWVLAEFVALTEEP